MSENRSLEEKIKKSNFEFEALAQKCSIPMDRLMQILFQLELVELNKQLAMIHEHLDEKMPLKKKWGKA
jgi:hypothetical protein